MMSMISTESRNHADDILQRLVGHGSFVNGILIDGPGVDAAHGLPVCCHVQRFLCLAPGHDAPRAMKSGEIPFGITAADRDDGTVAHIEGISTFSPLWAAIAPLRRIISRVSI